MAKKRVIIDTNFLLIPGQCMVDIFSELEKLMQDQFEMCYVDKSMDELSKIASTGREKDRFAAKLAVVLARQKSLKSLPSSKEDKSVDDTIVKYAGKDIFIATQDKALRERARKKGAEVIGLRQKKYLVVI
jgi:uncharacterized protein